jgi:hypothetical protein
MNSPQPESSRVPIYALYCAIVFGVAVLLRILVLDDDDARIAYWIYACGTWLPAMIVNLYEFHRLKSFMRQHHPELWRKWTQSRFFGEVELMPSGFTIARFIYFDRTVRDPATRELKRQQRHFLALVFVLVVSYVVFYELL